MKFIPILFLITMVQAIIEGRKTMTRRVMKPQPFLEDGSTIWSYSKDSFGSLPPNKMTESPFGFNCPYGKVGDVLWVREKFRYSQPCGCESLNYQYFSDMSIGESVLGGKEYLINDYDKWRPSLFMPKSACRIFLKITDIRVEKLNEISEEDANPWVWVIVFERIEKPIDFK